MWKWLLFTAGAVLLQVHGSAAPCMPGTLASYIALGPGGCVLGTLAVSAFGYKAAASGGAAKITADQVNVAPLLAPVGSFALQFSAPWGVESDQDQASHITYHVTSSTTGTQIQQVTLDGNGFTAGLFGNVIVSTALATPTTSFDLQTYLKCDEVCRSKPSEVVTLSSPASALAVVDRVTLNSKIGSATLSSFANWFIVCIPCV
jgi:hypothetical protein